VRRPLALTLGADQTLTLDGQPMHKAPTRAAAAAALQAMTVAAIADSPSRWRATGRSWPKTATAPI